MRFARCVVPAALVACLLATAACRSTTVRGTDGEEITTTTPRSMTLHRGHSGTLMVDITREKTTGPVTVALLQLPNGVKADQSSRKVETTSATFILTASKGADLVENQSVEVTVEDESGRKTTQYVRLSVRD